MNGGQLPPGPAWLFVPGSRLDRWRKAADRADVVVVDLENAVAPSDKAEARQSLTRVLDEVDAIRLVVRVNALGSPWYERDIDAVRSVGVTTVMLPKVLGHADLEHAQSDLPGVSLVALCETAASVVHAHAIGSTASCVALMWGGEDLAVDLGGTASHEKDGRLVPTMDFARSQIRYAARAAAVDAIDAPVLRVDRPDWVTTEARTASMMGYHAKACIHPDHVPLIRRAFEPLEEEVAWARAVVDASDELVADTGGTEVPVFVLDGQMIDHPVVALARTVLARTPH